MQSTAPKPYLPSPSPPRRRIAPALDSPPAPPPLLQPTFPAHLHGHEEARIRPKLQLPEPSPRPALSSLPALSPRGATIVAAPHAPCRRCPSTGGDLPLDPAARVFWHLARRHHRDQSQARSQDPARRGAGACSSVLGPVQVRGTRGGARPDSWRMMLLSSRDVQRGHPRGSHQAHLHG
ncbi:unnamed protein product [Urochloa humidicola]